VKPPFKDMPMTHTTREFRLELLAVIIAHCITPLNFNSAEMTKFVIQLSLTHLQHCVEEIELMMPILGALISIGSRATLNKLP